MKKMNNKGFSLVELIIVIAIMAILIGVLAPQYIKYVEKSRLSADKDSCESLKTAIQTAASDEDYYDNLEQGQGASMNSSGVAVVGTGTGVTSALNEYFSGWNNTKFKSKAFRSTTYTVTLTTTASSTALRVTENFVPGDVN